MQVTVQDAAERLGVSERRVRAMRESGRIAGTKLGGRWLVDLRDADLPSRLPLKPLSARSCWALILSTEPPEEHSFSPTPAERYRLKPRRGRLERDPDPLALLRSWLPNRAVRLSLQANPADLPALRADPRVALSGVSHPSAGLLAGNEVEGYVRAEDAAGLRDTHLLVEARPHSSANIVLHVVPRGLDVIGRGAPPLAVAADLAEHAGPRERTAARAIVDTALRPRWPSDRRDERVAWELHRAVADRLIRDPDPVLAIARRNIAKMNTTRRDPYAQGWVDEWQRLVDGPVPALIERMLDTDEHAIDLRQIGPFAGALTQEERVAAIRRASARP